ncbi:MAG: tRNA (adenosine(37)-N6)-threonylcarbamoyltransferase complex transferase subunit TsaD [Holosporales bacterium]|jgi:N6-L-threonylcarbamoyladenine synthase|nr:tRNA (adenosine(37)-N6)-threonylcarbamoyltransferase complex transferase subunit TsaD [Holosporales bacterium]
MACLILGLETSCDETAAAVVSDAGDWLDRLKSNVVYSQINEHQDFGGVVPELAARAHLEFLFPVIRKALHNVAHLHEISAFAATCGPGLIGGLLVGATACKALAVINQKPFIAVNHLAAHAQVCRLTQEVPFPFLLLLVSGGHCQFLEVRGLKEYKLLGATLDDSAGEVFDKIARLLEIDGGGRGIEKMAETGDQRRFAVSSPLKDRNNCDMSFSGMKTAFKILIQEKQPLSQQDKSDFAACLQNSITHTLAEKTKWAIKMAASDVRCSGIFVMAGGVAANKKIREAIQNVCNANAFTLVCPPTQFCTDNAAMVAWLGLEMYKAGASDSISFEQRPRWPLETLSLLQKF